CLLEKGTMRSHRACVKGRAISLRKKKALELSGRRNELPHGLLMKSIPMTSEGYAKIEDELWRRVRLDRRQLSERLRDATADGSNLAENAEFQAAIGDQESNEARIAELQEMLARAEVIDVSKLGGEAVKFGATGIVVDEDSMQMRSF